jgi:hypothetical protein
VLSGEVADPNGGQRGFYLASELQSSDAERTMRSDVTSAGLKRAS